MMNRVSLVVTSIAAPNDVLRSLALGAQANNWTFYVIGDVSSPSTFELDGSKFLSVTDQLNTGLATASASPTKHYSRKNIGYLLAMKDGADVIVETDDDNFPKPAFWNERSFRSRAATLTSGDWVNVYRYFTDAPIWPRGLPLDAIQQVCPDYATLEQNDTYCPIQQGLADENPDVDAIYRLAFPLPLTFRADRRVALGGSTWCPFNSQNTTWNREAFPLLYLPSYCSFRMTDIWRSFVAQRIAFANGWSLLFHESTVWQERNEHNLMKDFADEIPGYLHNRKICEMLAKVEVKPGNAAIPENLLRCYEALVSGGFVDQREMDILDAWISDLSTILALPKLARSVRV
jgi:STELLO glycosyltransferases